MKKILRVLILLISIVAGFFWRSTVSAPLLGDMEASIAIGSDGRMYLVENREDKSYIFGIERDGNIDFCYSEGNVGDDWTSEIISVYRNGNDIYFLRKMNVAGVGTKTDVARVLSAEEQLAGDAVGKFKDALTLYSDISVIFDEILMFTAKNDVVTVYGTVLEDTRVFGVELPWEEKPEGELTFIEDIPKKKTPVGMACIGSAIYIDFQDGSRMLHTMNGWVDYDYDRNAKLPSGMYTRAESYNEQGSRAVLAKNKDGGTALVYIAEGKAETIEEIRMSLLSKISFADWGVWSYVVIIGTVVLALLILQFVFKRSKYIAVRISIISVVSIMVLLSISTFSIVDAGERDNIKEQRNLVETFANIIESGVDIGNNGTKLEIWHVCYKDRLFQMEAQAGVVAGTPCCVYLDREAMKMLDEVGGLGISKNGVTGERMARTMAVVPVEGSLNRYLLLLRPVISRDLLAADNLRNAWIFGGIAVIILPLVVITLVSRITRPLRRLAKGMNSICEGDYQVPDIKSPVAETGTIWIAMKRLSSALRNNEHLANGTMQSYYRFVPRQIEELLNKESILAVENGDISTLNATIATVSVSNQNMVRLMTTDSEYMQYASSCFDYIMDNAKLQRGILLSNEFNLSGVKMIFRESADQAFSFGISLLTDLTQATGSRLAPEMFIMLHSARFLYGIVGADEQAFPFLASSELEFLNSYADDFRRTRTKMVITHMTLENLIGKHSTRYIGFVASSDGTHSFKLYEVLDAYSDFERKNYLAYNDRFQNALQLFYKNDFYLARSTFSSILKEYPGDGIARWYLFACEYYFNIGDVSKLNYSLFSTDIFEA